MEVLECMAQGCLDCKDIREAHFRIQGSEKKPEELFSEIYHPLEEIVAHNQAAFLLPRTHRYDSRREHHWRKARALSPDRAIEILNYCDKNVNGKLVLDDNGVVDVSVMPRTNWDTSMVKIPSILYIKDSSGRTAILREARTYDPKASLKRALGGLNSRFIRRTDYPQISEKTRQVGIESREILPIAEPSLVLALEAAHKTGLGERITPVARVAQVSADRLWYLRGFLPFVKDAVQDPLKFAVYAGTLQGLGLMDDLDGNEKHYCFEDGRVVNIDPDFYIYTANPNLLDQRALLRLREMWARTSLLPGQGAIPPEAEHKRKETMGRVKESLKSRRETFLKYVPASLGSAPILPDISIENFAYSQ